jgi:hypothetical protein
MIAFIHPAALIASALIPFRSWTYLSEFDSSNSGLQFP